MHIPIKRSMDYYIYLSILEGKDLKFQTASDLI